MTAHRPRLPVSLLSLGLALQGAHAMAAEGLTLAPTAVTAAASPDDGYRSDEARVAGWQPTALQDTPASISVFNRQLLDDRQVKLLSEVLRSDASVGESYAPIGYYENVNVRGFTLNAASSYRINGQTVVGEQNVALENKERVELLKGLAGLQSGLAAPGGLVNYVTKRPDTVHTLTLGGDDQGGRYLATDVGDWFGSERQFGVRVNLAHEDLRSYVDHADGHRNFASLALDWQISENALLQLDADYQQRSQRSVPGYQLLGGRELPHGVNPKDRLAHQAWSKPVESDALNLGGRFEYRLGDTWRAALSASRSHVLIDDYSAFAFGSAEGAFFGSDGQYDIYDFRSPDERRVLDETQATLDGAFEALGVGHELTVGLSAQRRTLDQRPYYSEYVGGGEIGRDAPALPPSEREVGTRERRLDSRQYGLFFNDRIRLAEQWQTVLGAREVRLDERTWDEAGQAGRHTQQYQLLPSAALLYNPLPDTTLYVSYAKGLTPGATAPWYTDNAAEILPPTLSRQWELGVKQAWQGLNLTAALFQIRQAYSYARPEGDGRYQYVQAGEQRNTGIELGASGAVTERLQVQASAAAIRARVQGTGTAAYEGHQALNVPRLRAAVQLDYSLPVDGLALLGGVRYSASKYADRSGDVDVAAYTVVDVGARYRMRLGEYDTVLRLSVDNLFDKRYWRDAGDYLGDDYLFQGAPRTARLSASIGF